MDKHVGVKSLFCFSLALQKTGNNLLIGSMMYVRAAALVEGYSPLSISLPFFAVGVLPMMAVCCWVHGLGFASLQVSEMLQSQAT